MSHEVCALILAAGKSTRMGQPKQLLPLGRHLLLEKVIHNVLLLDFSSVFAVIGNEADRIQRSIMIDDSRFSWLLNPYFEDGQSTSLKTGLQKVVHDHSNVMVFLGDLPFISGDTVGQLLHYGRARCSQQSGPFVVQPTLQGTAGHPVFFGNLQIEAFQNLRGDVGGKHIMKSMVQIQLESDDAGILYDIDTPEEYEQAKKMETCSWINDKPSDY